MSLLPIALVVIIGLVFGIILTFAAKIMYVPVDEIVAEVREALPGANCGACGYSGCDGYAAAFGEDRSTPVNKCPVGGPDLATKLGEILGQGNRDLTNDIMEYGKEMTCTAASQLFGGGKGCSSGCLGLGDCVRVCDFDAIHVVNGVAIVDRDKCVGCGMCAKECPKFIIDMITSADRVTVARSVASVV